MNCNILTNHPLKEYSTFRIGGNADYFAEPENEEDLRELLLWCKEKGLPYFILGHGSNVLFTDKGFRGMIIHFGQHFSAIRLEENRLYVGAGTLLKDLTAYCLKEELEGLVFACGIPASVGGAVFMNAGAYGGEMKDVVTRVRVMTSSGEIREYSGAEMEFGYRQSRIQGSDEIVLEAEFTMRKGDRRIMEKEIADLTQKREDKQPLDLPSAGSAFKRPEGYFAGKLIMDAGLRGFSCGDAAVSTKHCGFIVNQGNATYEDVIKLIAHIQKTVWEQFQVEMHPEIRMVGEK